MNTIIFKFDNNIKHLIYLTNSKKLYRNDIKKLFLKNKLMTSNQDFLINNKVLDYIRIFGDIEIQINFKNKILTKSIKNLFQNIDIKSKFKWIFFFIFLITIILIIILTNSELSTQISAWFLSIFGFLFFSISMLNYENNTFIEETNLKLSELNEMKSMFIANMSHEFKTPISNILGMCLILKDQFPQNSEVKNIENMGDHLIKMVNDILFFSKSSLETILLVKTNFKLSELIFNLYETIKINLHNKKIKFRINNLFFTGNFFQINSIIPFIIYGDLIKISRILINLLINAIKFSKKDSIIDLKINFIKLEHNYMKIYFKIIDRGIGIEESNISKIFLPFLQADVSTTRKYGGSGLGLAICNQLITAMNGNIIVSSKVDEGSIFTFFIILKYKKFEKLKELKRTKEVEEILQMPLHDNENEMKEEPEPIPIKDKIDIIINTGQNDYKLKLQQLGKKRILILDSGKILTRLITVLFKNIDNIEFIKNTDKNTWKLIDENEWENKINLIIINGEYNFLNNKKIPILECSQNQILKYYFLKIPTKPNIFYKTILRLIE